MLVATPKNWDAHVVHAEDVARGGGFRHLRDRIIDLADPPTATPLWTWARARDC
jgi:hypothetical protein